jgi:thiamine biosynthesis lipoprotein
MLTERGNIQNGLFQCMASPCELLVETDDKDLADRLLRLAETEARRIEHKFSRYRDDNIVHRINNSNGKPVEIDSETYRLLAFADQCFHLSEGLFDITSGVLRRCWRFDGTNRLPAQSQIDAVLELVGWDKLRFDNRVMTLPRGMEIDFGGIGKEYAVDQVLQILQQRTDCAMMVNFGGDCHANAPPRQGDAWITGIENPLKPGDAAEVLRLKHGALATSGDAYRFIEVDGVRYGHIIDPRTGWPVSGAPRSVTVASGTCTEAGILSTLSMLQGPGAEQFLQSQGVDYWCFR